MMCPLCGSHEFSAFAGRPNAKCIDCGALERLRLLWLILSRSGVLFDGMRILHIAPEPALAPRFRALAGLHYHPADLDTGRWKVGSDVFPLDCCIDLRKLPSDCFDLIVHLHVLEHLPCSVEAVLTEMTRILKRGGHHYFAVPFRGADTLEDLSDLSREERIERFGQHDHMRAFGTDEFPRLLRRLWAADPHVDVSSFLSLEEFEDAALPRSAYGKVTGNSIFHQEK